MVDVIDPALQLNRGNGSLITTGKADPKLKEARVNAQKLRDIWKKYPVDDVGEFLATANYMDTTLGKWIQDEVILETSTRDKICSALKEYSKYVSDADEKGKIKSYLNKRDFRTKIEGPSASIEGDIRAVNALIENSKIGKKAVNAPTTSKSHGDEVQQFWTDRFGFNNEQVDWATFIKGLSATLRSFGQSFTEEDENYLKAIIDSSHTGFINLYRFTDFLRGFGTLRTCVPYMKRVLSEKWFYGFLSGEESIRLLDGQPTGTYLVRFSRSRPGCFALSFVYSNGRVVSVLITGCMPEGLKIIEEGQVERVFETLYHVLEYYKKLFSVPFNSALSKEIWFHGDVTRKETEELLTGHKPGTFLVRFGDAPSTYCCSYVANDGSIQHSEIKSDSSGFLPTQTRGTAYATLSEYVKANRRILRFNYDPEGLPHFRVNQLDQKFVDFIFGPDDPLKPCDTHSRYGSGKSISTYPNLPGIYNMICDRFAVMTMTNWSLLCIADGCNWGPRPKDAAHAAVQGFSDYVKSQWQKMPTIKEVGHCLLRGFSNAHAKIIESKGLEAGTTTLLGGVLLELTQADRQGDQKYAFVCASIGDCKAFLWSPDTRNIIDITARNRGGMDARDPGGRLGPHVDGVPDVRNLKAFFELCKDGDIIILMTDGVHDNFDPKSLGKLPSDFGLVGSNWAEIPAGQAEQIKQKFQAEKLTALLEETKTCRDVVDKLTSYCVGVTSASRTFMETNPKAKEPTDYVLYPGKMDHTTAVAVMVGAKEKPIAL